MKRALAALVLAAAAAVAETPEEAGVAFRLGDLRSEDAGRRRAAVAALARIGDPAVPALAEVLDDGSWRTRREAARALAGIASDAAQPALARAARDVNWAVREAAVPGLAAGDALREAARDPIWRVRASACRAAARRDPAAVRRLVKDPVAEVRREAAIAIATSASPEYRPEMRDMLDDPGTAELGLSLFARIGRPEDAAHLSPLFDSPDPSLAARALRAGFDAGVDVTAPTERFLARTRELRDAPGDDNRERFVAMLSGLETIGPPAWAAIAKSLDPADENLAAEFAVILSRSGDPAAAKALKTLLGSGNADARYIALHALARIAPGEAAEAAMGMLKDPSPGIRVEAALLLTATDDGRAALVESWDKLDAAARHVAIAALGRDRSVPIRGLMQRTLRGGDPWERGAAHEWFIRHGDPQYLQEVEKHFEREQDAENRCRILAALEGESPRHPDLVLKACDDGQPSVRILAIRLLPRLDERVRGPALRRALGDGDPAIRIRALQAIEGTEGTADIEAFIDAMKDGDAGVRRNAVRLVTRSPRASTLLPVAFAAHDSESSVRWAAVEAVAAFPEDVAAWLLRDILRTDPDPLVRTAAARAAARFPACAEFLGDLAVKERSATARAAIVEAAAEAGGAGAAALLKRMAADEDALVRVAVATGMGRTPGVADLETLRRLAGDGDELVRISAATAIGQVAGAKATEALWGCASDASDSVRGAALAALIRRGEQAAVTRWLRQDPRSARLRTEVAAVLDEAGDPAQALGLLCGFADLGHEGLALAGWCAVELRLWIPAAQFLERAAIAGEPHPTGWDWAVLARALAAAGEGRPEAEGLVRAAVESAGSPDHMAGNAAYLLSESLLLPALSLELAQRAAAGPDPSPDVLDTLGWVQLRAGRPEDAEKTLLSIKSPPGPEGWLHRAAAQAATDHPAEAAASLREALLARPSLAPRARGNALLKPLFDRPELETWK